MLCPEKEDERIFCCVEEFMLTFDKMQNTGALMCTKFESNSSFLYCMHSSVYRVFWPSNQYVAVDDLITGQEHAIYRAMRTV